MNIVVTGAQGFIGKNLCTMLKELNKHTIIEVDRETSTNELSLYLSNTDFVYHLAGVNRPINELEFEKGNANLTKFITSELAKFGRQVPIMLSSSTQVAQENAYGYSKTIAEESVTQYGQNTGSSYYIYRFPNVFGKWCRPNYNSFIATFCHNILNDLDITINNPDASVNLVYIDDVCKELIQLIDNSIESGLHTVYPEYPTTVGNVAELLLSFKDSRQNLTTENVGTGLKRALYSTYLSYMSPSQFSYDIPSYSDQRGVFCEMLKTQDAGQFSFFTAHSGVTRGGHYHHSKNEKFLVIRGLALFKFENIITGERYEIKVEGDNPTIVETVPGWSHDITNIGENELIVMLWANEIFDRNIPDTIAKPL